MTRMVKKELRKGDDVVLESFDEEYVDDKGVKRTRKAYRNVDKTGNESDYVEITETYVGKDGIKRTRKRKVKKKSKEFDLVEEEYVDANGVKRKRIVRKRKKGFKKK